MTDMSHLDSNYFVDGATYNCPFCKRNHVPFEIASYAPFDWTNTKETHLFVVRCSSCHKRSLHLSSNPPTTTYQMKRCVFNLKEGLDERFFYSVPTSFFALDERIPRVLRELLTEADGCLKGNFLTGASACARKLVYELAKISEAVGENYEDRIKSLKTIHAHVDGSFFDTLLTIQDVTSTKVHENALDGWEAKHLRVILVAIREVLHEVYVVPAQRDDRRKKVLALKEELTPKPAPTMAEQRESLRRLSFDPSGEKPSLPGPNDEWNDS